MNRLLAASAVGILTSAIPVGVHAQTADPVYIECDDRKPNPVRIVLALDPANNTVGVVEWGDYTVSDVRAVSFGPDKVRFTTEWDNGNIHEFTVSRIDASVTKYSPLFDSTWDYEGCRVVDAPAERAF